MPLELLPLVPTDEQRAVIDSILAEPTRAALNGSDVGTGKTIMATCAALEMGAKLTVISAPLHTRYGWHDTIMRQTGYEANFHWVNSKNKAGREAMSNLQWGKPGFYFLGREYARQQDWSDIHPDLMVHDEAHSFQQRFSKGFKTAKTIDAGYTICQSATWYGSDFSGAYTAPRLMWPKIVPRSFWLWVDQWCVTDYDHFAPANKRITGEKIPGAWAESLPLYINLRNQQTEPKVIPIYVDLSPRQRTIYNQMERDGVAWLRENPLVAELPIIQRIRLRQITLAECDISPDGEVVFPEDAKSSKFDAVKELLSDLVGEKVLMATDSAKFARFIGGHLDSSFAWTGESKEHERVSAKADFMDGPLRYIVATQASISEGTDLLQTNCHILVELSRSDSPVLNQQMIGRLNRRGQSKQVIVYQILARGTLDDPQADTLLGRELSMRQSMLKEHVDVDSVIG